MKIGGDIGQPNISAGESIIAVIIVGQDVDVIGAAASGAQIASVGDVARTEKHVPMVVV